jgi:hypothetical protein
VQKTRNHEIVTNIPCAKKVVSDMNMHL